MTAPNDEMDEESGQPARPGAAVDLRRLVIAVRRQWRWLAFAAVVGAVAGVILAKTVAKRVYSSTAAIVWEPTDPNERRDVFNTLVDSIMLPGNVTEVRRRLKMKAPIESIARAVEVYADQRSNVVTIEATSPKDHGAADLANTVVAVFIDHCLSLDRLRAEEAVNELERNLDITRAALKAARDTYDTFRRDNHVSDVSTETQMAIEAAANLRSQAEAARIESEAEAARAQALDLRARQERSMVVVGATEVNPDAARLADLRSELIRARATLAPEHPRVLALEAQVQALAAQSGTVRSSTMGVNAQAEMIKSALSASTAARQAALQRQEAYTRYVTEAQDKLSKLSAVEGQAALLLADVNSAAAHVASLDARLNPAKEAVRNARAAFRVLALGQVPKHPESGQGKLYAAGVPSGMVLLTLLVLLGIELRGLRVHTASEAAFWLRSPAIGTTTWPRDPSMLDELLDELADCASASIGNTLVIGATEGDEAAAREIARGLSSRTQSAASPVIADEPARALIGPGGEVMIERTTLPDATALMKTASISDSTALRRIDDSQRAAIQAWEGGTSSISKRRASRLSDRVIVVLASNTASAFRVADLPIRLGRDQGLGVLVIGIDPSLAHLPDRIGDVDGFWMSERLYEDVPASG